MAWKKQMPKTIFLHGSPRWWSSKKVGVKDDSAPLKFDLRPFGGSLVTLNVYLIRSIVHYYLRILIKQTFTDPWRMATGKNAVGIELKNSLKSSWISLLFISFNLIDVFILHFCMFDNVYDWKKRLTIWKLLLIWAWRTWQDGNFEEKPIRRLPWHYLLTFRQLDLDLSYKIFKFISNLL